MKRRRTVPVRSSSGAIVELTREQCEAARNDGTRCPELDFRGSDGSCLCWTHRQAATFRGVLPLELELEGGAP